METHRKPLWKRKYPEIPSCADTLKAFLCWVMGLCPPIRICKLLRSFSLGNLVCAPFHHAPEYALTDGGYGTTLHYCSLLNPKCQWASGKC